jgi:DNA gyrase subunit A
MNDEDIFIVTEMGYIIKVATKDIKATGRVTYGVKGIGLKDGDGVVAAFPVSDSIGIITGEGKGKRMKANQFIIQNRGGRGVNCIKLDSDDGVAAAVPIPKGAMNDSLLIVGKPNSICIPLVELPEQTKIGGGIKVIERSNVYTAVRLEGGSI